MQKILVTLNWHFLSYYYSKLKLLFQPSEKIIHSWKMQSTINNHSKNNLIHINLLLKGGHESSHLQQSAQNIHKMSQNFLCLIIIIPSSFTLLPFLPNSSFINPFPKPHSQIKPRSNPSTSLTSFNFSVYYFAAPSALLTLVNSALNHTTFSYGSQSLQWEYERW